VDFVTALPDHFEVRMGRAPPPGAHRVVAATPRNGCNVGREVHGCVEYQWHLSRFRREPFQRPMRSLGLLDARPGVCREASLVRSAHLKAPESSAFACCLSSPITAKPIGVSGRLADKPNTVYPGLDRLDLRPSCRIASSTPNVSRSTACLTTRRLRDISANLETLVARPGLEPSALFVKRSRMPKTICRQSRQQANSIAVPLRY
jgi:hypothetical protein